MQKQNPKRQKKKITYIYLKERERERQGYEQSQCRKESSFFLQSGREGSEM